MTTDEKLDLVIKALKEIQELLSYPEQGTTHLGNILWQLEDPEGWANRFDARRARA